MTTMTVDDIKAILALEGYQLHEELWDGVSEEVNILVPLASLGYIGNPNMGRATAKLSKIREMHEKITARGGHNVALVSVERFTNFLCWSCDKWWSISDAPPDKTDWFCPWCGHQHSGLAPAPPIQSQEE